MDLSKLMRRDKEEEVRVKTLLELATKKYNLQKELETLRRRLVVKQGELVELRKRVLCLKSEVPVLEAQEEIVKRIADDLTTKLAEKTEETGKIQENIWRKIKSFVADANDKVALRARHLGDGSGGGKNSGSDRRDKIRQLKVESEIEAMHSYEKYQRGKMEELKLMRDLLEKDPFVI